MKIEKDKKKDGENGKISRNCFTIFLIDYVSITITFYSGKLSFQRLESFRCNGTFVEQVTASILLKYYIAFSYWRLY